MLASFSFLVLLGFGSLTHPIPIMQIDDREQVKRLQIPQERAHCVSYANSLRNRKEAVRVDLTHAVW